MKLSLHFDINRFESWIRTRQIRFYRTYLRPQSQLMSLLPLLFQKVQLIAVIPPAHRYQ